MVRVFIFLLVGFLFAPLSVHAQYSDPRQDWWYFYRQPRNVDYYAPAAGGYPTYVPTATPTPTPTYYPTAHPTHYPTFAPTTAEAHARATATAADGTTATAEAHAVASSGSYGYGTDGYNQPTHNQQPIAFTLSGEPVFFVSANDAYYRFFPVNTSTPANYCQPSWYWQWRWRAMQWGTSQNQDYPMCQLRYNDQDFFYSPVNQQMFMDYETPYAPDPIVSRKLKVKEVVKTRNHKYVYKTVIKDNNRMSR